MPHRVQQTESRNGTESDMDRKWETSMVKRERDRKKQTQLMVQRMREQLPIYTLHEIRLMRMPYWEALMVETDELGYKKTIEYLRKIFEMEEEHDRPILKNRKHELEKLIGFLKMHEMYLNQEDAYKACMSFLKGAVHFAFLSKRWWWLGNQMLLDAIDMTLKLKQKKWEAFSRFCYAKFMIENLKDYGGVEEHLVIAQQHSTNEPWVMKMLFPDLKDTLYMHVSFLLYLVYIRTARILENGYPEQALEFAAEAKKNASAACHSSGQMEASIVKATCEMSLDRIKDAISTLNRALTQQISKKSFEGICKVKAYLVKAHLCNDNVDKAYAILNDLRELKNHFEFPIYLAIAYKALGEYYLLNGASQVADPFITEALLILEQGDSSLSTEIMFMRGLEAITTGLEMMPLFIKHIRLAGTPGPQQQKSILVLTDWKNERRSFWSRSTLDARRQTIIKSRGILRDVSKPVKPLDLMDPSTKLQNVEKKLAKLLANEERPRVIQLMPIRETSYLSVSSEESVSNLLSHT